MERFEKFFSTTCAAESALLVRTKRWKSETCQNICLSQGIVNRCTVRKIRNRGKCNANAIPLHLPESYSVYYLARKSCTPQGQPSNFVSLFCLSRSLSLSLSLSLFLSTLSFHLTQGESFKIVNIYKIYKIYKREGNSYFFFRNSLEK